MDSFRYNLINVTHLLLLCLFSPLSPHHHHVLGYMNALSSTQNYYLLITQNFNSNQRKASTTQSFVVLSLPCPLQEVAGDEAEVLGDVAAHF